MPSHHDDRHHDDKKEGLLLLSIVSGTREPFPG